MKNKNRNYLFILLLVFVSNSYGHKKVKSEDLHLIPMPQEIVMKGGVSRFDVNTIYTDLQGDEKERILSYINHFLFVPNRDSKSSKSKVLQLLIDKDKFAHSEAYMLDINSNGIVIKAKAGIGIFYGLQTLMQLVNQYGKKNLPNLIINDTPYLGHRGFMLDVSRHFFSKEFIKKQLDMMAYYKINRFQWHLVDGAGWRIEIKKYPELTRKAAWRTSEDLVAWDDKNKQYCTKDTVGAYGGYYSQEDIREIVKYASDRYITVIPEIEMPGHSEEVLATYPELTCQGKPYVSADYCVGNPDTFVFLENVLTEVMDLFPSEYIHIGGDEAEKKDWSTCKKCSELMKTQGLKNVEELQSYLIHRIEKFINSHGRKLLGWDEIMQGGLAPNSTVMSWRGEEYGLNAVKNAHDAIMTPIKYCYFNFYQDAPTFHVLSWAGYTPLEKVYGYNPVPDSLNTDNRKRILGIQANLWTEFIPTEENAELMIWPRLLAIAETGWTSPQRKDYDRFRKNALNAVIFLRSKGYKPFNLKKEIGERKEYFNPIHDLAYGKKIEYKRLYNNEYAAGGKTALVDGIQGGWAPEDNRWQGFIGGDMDVVVDLGSNQLVRKIYAYFEQDSFGWYWLPKEVEIYASTDSVNYKLLASIKNDIPFSKTGFFLKKFGWSGKEHIRYIRYVAKPDLANKKVGYIFTDELIVE